MIIKTKALFNGEVATAEVYTYKGAFKVSKFSNGSDYFQDKEYLDLRMLLTHVENMGFKIDMESCGIRPRFKKEG